MGRNKTIMLAGLLFGLLFLAGISDSVLAVDTKGAASSDKFDKQPKSGEKREQHERFRAEEKALHERFEAEKQALHKRFEEEKKALFERFQTEKQRLHSRFEEERRALHARFK